jgi:branched-subunit amino acid transport protein
VKDNSLLIAGVLIMSVGTYGFRLAGPLLRTKVRLPPRAVELLETAAVVLLTALVAVTALTQGHGSAGFARPAGVAVAGLLAWRKAPFIVVVAVAALTTALLRLVKL